MTKVTCKNQEMDVYYIYNKERRNGMKPELYALIQFYDNINSNYKIIYMSQDIKKVKNKMLFLIETNNGKNKRYKIMKLS